MKERNHDWGSEKWDKRYRKGKHSSSTSSKFISEWIEKIPNGKALDVACGAGRNSMYLAKNGYDVYAIDFSEEAIDKGKKRSKEANVKIKWINEDIFTYNFPTNEYELVLISYFHPKNKLEEIKKAVKSNGFFLYEHHIVTDKDVEKGPSVDELRYEKGEMKKLFSDFKIHHYEEKIEGDVDERKAVARIVAEKTNFQ